MVPFGSLQTPLGSRQRRWPGSKPLPGAFGCICLHRALACQSRCLSLFRRFESAVCQPANPSRAPVGPLAPNPFPGAAALLAKAGACHSLGVSKAPFASPQTLLGSLQRRWPGSKPLPRTFGLAKPLAGTFGGCFAWQSRRMSLFARLLKTFPGPLAGTFGRCFALAKPVRVTL